MKVILLAAGYATRLYPLTENCPKPLLKVAGQAMLDHVLEAISPISSIEEVIVVTNSKFATHFQQWAQESPFRLGGKPVRVVDDLTTDDKNKRGAIGDIYYVVKQLEIKGDILVLAGDNLFEKDLKAFGELCLQRQAPVVGVYDVGDLELIKKYSCVSTDSEGKITSFEEKPAHPQTTLCAIALYYYPAATVELIEQYVNQGNNPDQPGRFVAWLYTRQAVYTWKVPGLWYDIGSKEGLEEADRVFSQLAKGEK